MKSWTALASTSKSLAQMNKSSDVGKATKKHSALRDASRAERAEFYFELFCQLAPAVNGWGLFPSMAAMNNSLAQSDKSPRRRRPPLKKRSALHDAAERIGPNSDVVPLCLTCPGLARIPRVAGAFSVHGFNKQIFGVDEQVSGPGPSD